jgi:hypothetical protein
LLASGCRWVFGIHDTVANGDGNLADAIGIDGPPDSATGGCVVHDNCTSGACLPDGTCANPQDIAWVDENGGGNACARTAPCARITDGIATARPYLRVHGTIDDTVATSAQFTILADAGAQLTRTTSGAIFVANGGADVAVYDFEFNGAPGVTGLVINGGAKVTLERSHVRACDGGGITNNGTLVVSRSLVDQNPAGGIINNSGVFTIVNSILVYNGSNNSNAGAIQIIGSAVGSTIELDTIAANGSKNAGEASGGVSCMSSFTVARTLLAGNTVSNDPNNNKANANGLCNVSTSMLVTTLGDFVAPTLPPYDFHLAPTSTAIDHASTSAITTDYDGDTRPQGIAFDYGADEYKP